MSRSYLVVAWSTRAAAVLAADGSTEPRDRRMLFPAPPSKTLVITAYRRMAVADGRPVVLAAFDLVRRHVPRLLWDLDLQSTALTAFSTGTDWLERNGARGRLQDAGLGHLVDGPTAGRPRGPAADLNARHATTTGGVPVPIPSPAPGPGPGLGDAPPAPADAVIRAVVTLFGTADLRRRFDRELAEARDFVHRHLRYARDRACCDRQRRFQEALDRFTLDFGGLPRGDLRRVAAALAADRYIAPDQSRCVDGPLFDFDRTKPTRAVSCPIHGWYGDWQHGPSPYAPSDADRILRRNAVLWAFLHEHVCRLRRRAVRRAIVERVGPTPRSFGDILDAAAAVAARLGARATCPLDGRPFTVHERSLNDRAPAPFHLSCPNHAVEIRTAPAAPSWPGLDSTGPVRSTTVVAREPIVNSAGMQLVCIPPGSCEIGSPSTERDRAMVENPRHTVTLTEGFWMAAAEVTTAQYRSVLHLPPVGDAVAATLPQTGVAFVRALEFCDRLTARERAAGTLAPGWRYTLPSEAQWEYACRAGSLGPFATGDTLTADQANFLAPRPYGSSLPGPWRRRPLPVRSFRPNAFELYDMHGNVAEWCLDRWRDTYDGAPTDGSARTDGTDRRRVVRGGSWRAPAVDCRSAARQAADGADGLWRTADIGLRPVVFRDRRATTADTDGHPSVSTVDPD